MAEPLPASAPRAENWQRGGFGLYIHWPFCAAKCPYCDFNSHVAATIDHWQWADAYLSELRRVAAETPGRILQSVYFGGGTPSLMMPETVARVLEEVRRLWPMVNDPEITLEANPGSVETGRFRGFRQAGVNRVSLGVQALDDGDLKALGRIHSAKEARAAIAIARAEFDRVSFDLIYARQGQSRDIWRSELREALDIGVDHLSLYQLTIEPGTMFGRRHAAGRLPGLPDEDLSADMYEDTQEICAEAGMPAYEISNHARPGAQSRHNLIYWRGGDWLGVGPGAHGRVELNGQRTATETFLAPGAWLRAVSETGNGESRRYGLSDADTAEEYLMMGLRLSEGCELSRLDDLSYDLSGPTVSDLCDAGLLQIVDGRLCATLTGRMVLNAVLQRLLAG